MNELRNYSEMIAKKDLQKMTQTVRSSDIKSKPFSGHIQK